MPQPLCSALLGKIHEQIERADHLMSLLPGVRPEWTPAIPGARPLGWLLAHMQDCLAGFCAVLYAARPEDLAHFSKLRDQGIPASCGIAEARARMAVYRDRIDEGFGVLADEDLRRRLATVFVLEGEMVMTLLLGNLEHLVSHKYQLFVYVRMAGVEAGTRDLYQFRNQKTERT
jgi:hypothetical protein